MTGYARARPVWHDWTDTTTAVRAQDLEQWENALYDVKRRAFNIKDYGAVGDYNFDTGAGTDNSSAVQACGDDVTAYLSGSGQGADIWLPPGYYRSLSNFNIATAASKMVRIRGGGPPGYSKTLAKGTSVLIVDGNHTGITYGQTGQNTNGGFGIENLHICGVNGTTTAAKGVVIQNANRSRFRDVVISDFTSGTGLEKNTSYGQYDSYIGCDFNKCKIGVDILVGDANFTDCVWDGANNTVGAALVAGSIALRVGSSSNVRVQGGNAQSYETLFYLNGGSNHSIWGVRGEDFVTGIRFANTASGCLVSVIGWFSNQAGQKLIICDAACNNNTWAGTWPGAAGLITNNGSYNWGLGSLDGNLTIASADAAGMIGGVALHNAFQDPTGTPANGGVLYVSGGALKYKGSSGTVTTIAPA